MRAALIGFALALCLSSTGFADDGGDGAGTDAGSNGSNNPTGGGQPCIPGDDGRGGQIVCPGAQTMENSRQYPTGTSSPASGGTSSTGWNASQQAAAIISQPMNAGSGSYRDQAANIYRSGSSRAAGVGMIYCAEGANRMRGNSAMGGYLVSQCQQSYQAAEQLKAAELNITKREDPASRRLTPDPAILGTKAGRAALGEFESSFGVSSTKLSNTLSSGKGSRMGAFASLLSPKVSATTVAEGLAVAGNLSKGKKEAYLASSRIGALKNELKIVPESGKLAAGDAKGEKAVDPMSLTLEGLLSAGGQADWASIEKSLYKFAAGGVLLPGDLSGSSASDGNTERSPSSVTAPNPSEPAWMREQRDAEARLAGMKRTDILGMQAKPEEFFSREIVPGRESSIFEIVRRKYRQVAPSL